MITPHFFQRGTGGVPTTTALGVFPNLSRYQHSICAQGGFESFAVDFSTDLASALFWKDQLMSSIICYDRDGRIVWEGALTGVSLQIGQEQIDLSLDNMANAVKVRYQSEIGVQTSTAFTTNTTSISRYGRKELVYSGSGMTSTAATALRNTLLAARKDPVAQRSSEIGGSAQSDIRVTLTGTGWYFLLGWLTLGLTSTSVTATTTQVQDIILLFNGINNWFSTNFLDMVASGVSDTVSVADDTTYRAAIERLLNLGNSSNQRLAWGIYAGRKFRTKAWAGATPTVITYQRSLGDGTVYDKDGGEVLPWNVRPDTIYQIRDFVDPVTRSAPDSVARYYVERVTCTVTNSGASVRLEPARSTSVDVLLARLR